MDNGSLTGQDVTVERYRDGTLQDTSTTKRQVDPDRQAAIQEYKRASQALANASGVPNVFKDWAKALTNVLRYLDSEL